MSASVGVEGSLPVSTISDVISTGKTVTDKAKNNQTLTSAEKWQAFDTGVELLLSPIGVGYHLDLAYVPWKRLEVSLRYANSAARLRPTTSAARAASASGTAGSSSPSS